ncbi:MAG: RNA pseudouridine synthase [Planctomyces sp.]|nr:RNA pseudouridine synthase [Planctomyces sp.]
MDAVAIPATGGSEPVGDSSPRILLEDGPLLGVWKPAGLLTQGVPGGLPTLESWVREWLKQRYQKTGNVYLGIPHRLDRPVSGVIVFARNSKAAARLSEVFRERRVKKTYVAVVRGRLPAETGTLNHWLLKDAEAAHSLVVPEGTPGSKIATLEYRVLEARDDRSLVEVDLQTGRMHQIRVQMAAMSCPVLGDWEYGSTSGEPAIPPSADADPTARRPAVEQIALHARRLEIPHPIRFDNVLIEAPFPTHWTTYWLEG